MKTVSIEEAHSLINFLILFIGLFFPTLNFLYLILLMPIHNKVLINHFYKHLSLALFNRFISFIVLLLLVAPLAHATDYFVATNGKDRNAGTIESPWRTIGKAAKTLVAGDTVYIRAGTYLEQVLPKNSGNPDELITYTAYPGESVIISGDNGLNWQWNGIFGLINLSNILISDLIIINSPGFGFFLNKSTNIQIRDNYFENTFYSGIHSSNCHYLTIDSNEVVSANTGFNQESITLSENTTNFIVSNNRVHDGNMEGIDLKDGTANGKIFGNTIYNMARIGIYIDGWSTNVNNIEIYNNNISNSSETPSSAGEDGIRVGAELGGTAYDIKIFKNIIYNIAGAGIAISDYVVNGFKLPTFNNITIHNNIIHECGTRISIPNCEISIASTVPPSSYSFSVFPCTTLVFPETCTNLPTMNYCIPSEIIFEDVEVGNNHYWAKLVHQNGLNYLVTDYQSVNQGTCVDSALVRFKDNLITMPSVPVFNTLYKTTMEQIGQQLLFKINEVVK